MTKKRATAEVIQAAMQRRIEAGGEHGNECDSCKAPIPMPLVVPRNGGNWTEGYYRAGPGCQSFIAGIIDRAKAEYDLI